LVAKAAREIGQDDVAAAYERVFQDIKAAFNERYVAADGRIIPANTTATVYVPANPGAKVTEGGKPAESAEGVRFVRTQGNAVRYEVGSGEYTFVSSRVTLPGPPAVSP
jgi:alpha-L-rhamnosidase